MLSRKKGGKKRIGLLIASIIISLAIISIILPTIQISAFSQFPIAVRISQISSGFKYQSFIGKSEMATTTTTALSMQENKDTRSNTSVL